MYCVNCGIQLPEPSNLCPQCGCPNRGLTSTKSLSSVALLCMFFGFLGVHRFYMGKIASGIFMFLTFGGLGLWAFADLLWAVCGKFRDQYGLPITATGETGNLALTLICVILGFYALIIIGLFASMPFSIGR
ncbi:MAG: TM2 domain-containing protein [Deltaproteobacteria bacterium]|jgi:hypothetical protein|nr:TM2 domain-containing protein [Deltaproteobacteria bacterium]